MVNSRDNPYWPTSLPFQLTIPGTSVAYNLEVSAARFAAKPCLFFYGTSITYAQLHSEVDRLAGWLQQHGVRKGDRVIVNLQNCPQFIIAYYAILRADAIVVPVNPMNRTQEFEHILRDCGAQLVITAQDTWEVVDSVPKDSLRRVLLVTYSDYLDRASSDCAPDFIRQPRRELKDARVTSWADALAGNFQPTAAVAGPTDHSVIV